MNSTITGPCFLCRNKIWVGAIWVSLGLAGMTGLILAITLTGDAPYPSLNVACWLVGLLFSAGSMATGIASCWAHQRTPRCFPLLPSATAKSQQEAKQCSQE